MNAASFAATDTTQNAGAIPLLILLAPILFALFNIVMAYIGGAKFKELKRVARQHDWLLQQKNNALALLRDRIEKPLSEIGEIVAELYKDDALTLDNKKTLTETTTVSLARIQNVSRELQRSTLSLTLEPVDTVPFYRSATTIAVVFTTGFMLVVVNAVLVSTESLQLTIGSVVAQVVAFLLVAVAVALTNRYKRISDTLLAHSKATLRLQESVDDAKDHIISLVVKIIAADIEKLKADITLLVPKKSQTEINDKITHVDHVVSRLQLLNDIESRLIKSDVKLLKVEELIEEVFREHQQQLNDRGLQVEHFHRVGAAKIQTSIVQDRSLLKQAFAEVFENAITHAPEHSVIKILSEHNVLNSSITVADQGSGEPFAHTAERPLATTGDSIGIGLYLADQIAHILGGELLVTNTKGVGSNVKISFINNYVR